MRTFESCDDTHFTKSRYKLMTTEVHELNMDRLTILAADNMHSAVELQSTIYQRIKELDDHWLSLLFGDRENNQTVSSLMANSHNFFRASAGLIFAGNPAPVYCLLRTAIESAIYAAMISSRFDLEVIWINRNVSETGKAKCRNEFTTTKSFEFLRSVNPDLTRDCKLLYETYIDYGAHPNILGTFTFISPGPETHPGSLAVNYLQGNSRETRIAAYQLVQLGEACLHIAMIAMPRRTQLFATKKFLETFSPNIKPAVFGL